MDESLVCKLVQPEVSSVIDMDESARFLLVVVRGGGMSVVDSDACVGDVGGWSAFSS